MVILYDFKYNNEAFYKDKSSEKAKKQILI